MTVKFDTLTQIYDHGFDALIDVRSPAEFAEDHIPGAINLPVLTDAERAQVGTIYVQDSAFKARKIGGALVAQNAARHLQGPLADKDGGWRPLVYCWRGGQRSGSFASILSQIGWRADVVDGGYRSYRRLVVGATREAEIPHKVILLEGNTGTAKTELLHLLAAQGGQIVDLEGLAAHRGSVFGGVSTPQPSQKSFEGALAQAFEALDPEKPVLLEAESSRIGQVQIPTSIWKAMRSAPRISITAPIEARAQYLTRAYQDITGDAARLKSTLSELHYLQGKEVVERWHAMVEAGALVELARELMELHYDPRYGKSRGRDEVVRLGTLSPQGLSQEDLEKTTEQLGEMIANAF